MSSDGEDTRKVGDGELPGDTRGRRSVWRSRAQLINFICLHSHRSHIPNARASCVLPGISMATKIKHMDSKKNS